MAYDVASYASCKCHFTHGLVWLPDNWIRALIPSGKKVYLLVENAVKHLVTDKSMLPRRKPGRKGRNVGAGGGWESSVGDGPRLHLRAQPRSVTGSLENILGS